MPSNVAGALAYVTIIPAIIFLVAEPYNRDRFIRFHSFQSIFFAVGWLVFCLALGVLGSILTAITAAFGALVMLPLWGLLSLAAVTLWIFLVYKAYGNEMYMLPVVGSFAAKQAGV